MKVCCSRLQAPHTEREREIRPTVVEERSRDNSNAYYRIHCAEDFEYSRAGPRLLKREIMLKMQTSLPLCVCDVPTSDDGDFLRCGLRGRGLLDLPTLLGTKARARSLSLFPSSSAASPPKAP